MMRNGGIWEERRAEHGICALRTNVEWGRLCDRWKGFMVRAFFPSSSCPRQMQEIMLLITSIKVGYVRKNDIQKWKLPSVLQQLRFHHNHVINMWIQSQRRLLMCHSSQTHIIYMLLIEKCIFGQLSRILVMHRISGTLIRIFSINTEVNIKVWLCIFTSSTNWFGQGYFTSGTWYYFIIHYNQYMQGV